jgi:hypothetical protein
MTIREEKVYAVERTAHDKQNKHGLAGKEAEGDGPIGNGGGPSRCQTEAPTLEPPDFLQKS